MPSCVGITTDPECREKGWESEYPSLYDWENLETYDSKSESPSAP